MAGSKTINVTMRVAVPEWARWMAFDGAGSIWAFEAKPIMRDAWWEKSEGRQVMVAKANWWYVDQAAVDGDLYVGWRYSLKELEVL